MSASPQSSGRPSLNYFRTLGRRLNLDAEFAWCRTTAGGIVRAVVGLLLKAVLRHGWLWILG
eukprot:4240132-Alexandrium_andersonii.AAC.1